MSDISYQRVAGHDITDSMLKEASALFNGHYGVWGEAAKAFATPGKRVRMSVGRLRTLLLPDPDHCSLVRVVVNSQLVGHAFACRWKRQSMNICWVTQLVVHSNYRRQGLAVGLLSNMREAQDDVFGIASSHPAACMAASKACKTDLRDIDLDFIRQDASAIMRRSPVEYVQNARLVGSLFNKATLDGSVSLGDTGFFVDHAEPLQTLDSVRSTSQWPLGELLEGHEFIMLTKVR
ncbi:MAG: hypothetical protein L6R36_000610 [Xanthoria steineri]|nr:MAG: hypothetical protein L6R36_000610 [Xanthoria steineri]